MNGSIAAGTHDHQPDLLARLHNVVHQLNRSDIRTPLALIAKVLGDQNAAIMCIRLLHWFPRSRKAGGWVYKSWRDWNAECNLSQAQVKRVHANGFLETIGIERKTMKANGTPTMHYRIDETRLVERLAEFLGVVPFRIQNWMRPERPNQDGQSNLSNEADPNQCNWSNHLDSSDVNRPMISAKDTKSITDSDSHTKQHKESTDLQHNMHAAVVVCAETAEKENLLRSLEKLGITHFKVNQLIERHGQKQVVDAFNYTKDRNFNNPAGYIIRAIENNWNLRSEPIKEIFAYPDGKSYITGKYAEFIEH